MTLLKESVVHPTKKDQDVATKTISAIENEGGKGKYKLSSSNGDKFELTQNTFELLVTILKEMSNGNGIVLMPLHAELSTQQAADYLNVSRPFLVGLLEKHAIPFRTVGRHRRVRLEDILNYKRSLEENRLTALEELSAQAQELDMGY